VEFNKTGLAKMVTDGLIVTEMTDSFRDDIYKVGYKIAHTEKWMSVLGEDVVNQMYPSETRS
jgi:hypothetical protein